MLWLWMFKWMSSLWNSDIVLLHTFLHHFSLFPHEKHVVVFLLWMTFTIHYHWGSFDLLLHYISHHLTGKPHLCFWSSVYNRASGKGILFYSTFISGGHWLWTLIHDISGVRMWKTGLYVLWMNSMPLITNSMKIAFKILQLFLLMDGQKIPWHS